MSKPTPALNLTDATTLTIAAGTSSDYAARASSTLVSNALEKLSLRFAELALEALGGESGKDTGDEAASA